MCNLFHHDSKLSHIFNKKLHSISKSAKEIKTLWMHSFMRLIKKELILKIILLIIDIIINNFDTITQFYILSKFRGFFFQIKK